MVQTRVAPEMRGRVMALYMAIFMGGTPAGAPLIGWISEQFGPRWTIGIGAVAVAVALVGVSVWLARSQNVRVSYESQRRPRVRVTASAARRGAGRTDGRRAGAGPVTPRFRRRMTLGVLAVLVAVAMVYALTR